MKTIINFITNNFGANNDEIRSNWVISQVKSLPKGIKLLDAGAGELRFKEYCDHLEYISQDFGKYDGEGDGKGFQMGSWDNKKLDIVSDITSIPLPDCYIDAILCTEVFEHIPDAISALREFNRLLKPGGTMLITAPFCSLTHFAPYHYCGYNRYWYKYHLETLGYKDIIIDHNGSWFAFIAQELRRGHLVGKTYSGKLIARLLQIASLPLLILLNIASMKDRGSQDLLCFGFMIKATKEE